MTKCEKILNVIKFRTLPRFKSDGEILVSIIVLNRDGLHHLKILIPALITNTKNISYELLLVDNNSKDDSINFVKSTYEKLTPGTPVTIIKNKVNESFSVANNKAAKLAKGKYIVLLNNDVEPLNGWLEFLVSTAQKDSTIGSVGARLVYPFRKKKKSFKQVFKKSENLSCRIQHSGIAFMNEVKQFRPYNLGTGKAFDDPLVEKSVSRVALTAACLLVPKQVYLEIGGLDESYHYGGEDVDFGLKLLKSGYQNYYCTDAVLFHHEFGTQSKEARKKAAKRREKNLKVFQHKWFITVKKNYWQEKISGKYGFFSEYPLTIGTDTNLQKNNILLPAKKFGWKIVDARDSYDFKLAEKGGTLVLTNNQLNYTLVDNDLTLFRDYLTKRYLNPSIVIKIPAKTWKGAYSWGDYHMAVLLKQHLEDAGHYVLLQIYPEWNNDEGKEFDVALVLRGVRRYAVKQHQINIMWNISHPDDITLEEYEEYDQVFIASEFWAEKISEQINKPVKPMLQCTDVQRFKPALKVDKDNYRHQLLFVGNSRGIFRKILIDLLPTSYELAVYGKGWKKYIPKALIKGEHIPNQELYKYYGAAEILLNDHWDDMREKGFISNRIFDGLASGAFIITDSVRGMSFLNDYLQTYETPEELYKYIKFYLDNPAERRIKTMKAADLVATEFSYAARAKTLSKTIHKLLKKRLKGS